MQKILHCPLKRGLDQASNFGKFLKENKGMTPGIGITVVAVARCCFGFQNTFQRVPRCFYSKSELGMIQFIHMEVLFAFWPCVLFSFMVRC